MHPPLHWNGSDDPEPLSGSELHSIQTRLSELGLISGPPDIPSTVSTRENELLQMVRGVFCSKNILDPLIEFY